MGADARCRELGGNYTPPPMLASVCQNITHSTSSCYTIPAFQICKCKGLVIPTVNTGYKCCHQLISHGCCKHFRDYLAIELRLRASSSSGLVDNASLASEYDIHFLPLLCCSGHFASSFSTLTS